MQSCHSEQKAIKIKKKQQKIINVKQKSTQMLEIFTILTQWAFLKYIGKKGPNECLVNFAFFIQNNKFNKW